MLMSWSFDCLCNIGPYSFLGQTNNQQHWRWRNNSNRSTDIRNEIHNKKKTEKDYYGQEKLITIRSYLNDFSINIHNIYGDLH